MTSSGCTITPATSRPAPASAAASAPSTVRLATRLSNAGASVTPSARSTLSARRRSPLRSVSVTASRARRVAAASPSAPPPAAKNAASSASARRAASIARCTLASMRKPVSSVSWARKTEYAGSASRCSKGFSSWSWSWSWSWSSERCAPSPSSSPSSPASTFAALAFAAAAARFFLAASSASCSGGLKTSSEGACHVSPSCCSCITRSACSTRFTLAATVSSFMAHTSWNFRMSASSKCRYFACRSLNCSVTRLYSSVRRTFSSWYRLSESP
mmetsp:Transcript_20059/g.49959  ORF Transcript_20059/g.49959 Transcript_20059/m.49959 type:complete len:273 (+) Transcript_20059:964-1782(+)